MADAVLDSSTSPPAAICKCGATAAHPTDATRCESGHPLVGSPGPAFKHGVYAYQNRGPQGLPPDLRLSVEEFQHGVICDRGGRDNLTTLKAGSISKIKDIEAVLRLYNAEIMRRGVFTEGGRERSMMRGWREFLKLWLQYKNDIGDDSVRNTLTLTQRLAAAAPLTSETEDPDAGE